MIGQLHFAGVTRKSGGLSGCDVEKHLLRFHRDYMDRPIAHFDHGPLRMRLPRYARSIPALRRKARRPFGDDRFEPLYGILIRRSTDVAGTVIMIVRVYTTHFAVLFYASSPIVLVTVPVPIRLDFGEASLLSSQRVIILKILRLNRQIGVLELTDFLLQR